MKWRALFFIFFSTCSFQLKAQKSRIWLRHFDTHKVGASASVNSDYAYVNWLDGHRDRFQVRSKYVLPLSKSKVFTLGIGGGFWKDWWHNNQGETPSNLWQNEIRLNQDFGAKHGLGIDHLKVTHRLRFEERYFWRENGKEDWAVRLRYLVGLNYYFPWPNVANGKQVFVMVINEIFMASPTNQAVVNDPETNRFSLGMGYKIGEHWQIDFTYILEDNLTKGFRLYENVFQLVVRSRF
ncbi:DUF2490 domain-containing protein [Persicobacter diffluens]|uniref:DUF2490 domain-containing protein n=1 Tax=Persicobacter diffluens TaxID=981 RepID=A0AAN5APB0_9BACT|nr:hypothetical protein PEDI_41950 [Persicobacter diffluens]